jgi:hypothetical protein
MHETEAGAGPNLLKYFRPEAGEKQEPVGAGVGGVLVVSHSV